MKKIILLLVFLVSVIILPAQGVYQLWGTMPAGGSNDLGVLFSTDAAGNNFRLRYTFNGVNGYHPEANLTQGGDKIYGLARNGGNEDLGVIFEFNPATNIYTKKIDLNDSMGSNPTASMTLSGGKFYGTTSTGGSNGNGVIFEWDPSTNVYTKRIDFETNWSGTDWGKLTPIGSKLYGLASTGIFEWDPATNMYTKLFEFNANSGFIPYGYLTLSNGKLYGRTSQGGIYNSGTIFGWDPATNVFTKKIDFPPLDGGYPGPGSLTLKDGKLYGMTFGEGEGTKGGGHTYGGGIFEWDPLTNVYTTKIDLYTVGGVATFGNLTLSGNKFYGLNGSGNNGGFFEWDPASNIYTTKKHFQFSDGREPASGNTLTLVQAPAAQGLAGSCISFPSVTIDTSNNNKWVSITDTLGNAVAELKANGNNLGVVTASMYINNSAEREDGNKKLYLDRNITLTPQVQPTSPVDIRLYIKGSEFMALKNALNSNGDSSGIRSINDIVIYKNENDCSQTITVLTDTVSTKAEAWEADYVFTTSISSFSSFYFAGRALPCNGPIIQCKADTVVNSTDHHCGAVVRFNPPVVKDACGTSTVKQIAGLPSGALFPIGNTINTYVASSSSGKTDTCSFTVTVKDTKPPFITPVWAFPSVLWPPNHKMKNVSANYYAFDNCGPASCSLEVSSDEPVTGTGYGDKAPDWVIVDNHHVQLRAERAGHGNGRTYTITVTCTDASGNTSTQNTKVFVPHHLHPQYSKGEYSFGAGSDGYIDSNGDYFDEMLVCKVLPNPSNQYFNLEIESASNEKIEVNLYDISGRFVSKLNAVKNQTYKFGDDLRPGMYMVEVRQGQQRKTVKVVKQ